MKSIKPMLGGGRSDGRSVSNKLVVGGKGKCLDTKSRTRPYYFRKCKRMRHTTTTTATATTTTTTTTTSIDSLPAELLFEILLRLPADHLIERARFVCRRWSRIIHSHTFVNAQILHSPYQLLLSCDSRPILIIASLGGGRRETSELSYECRTQLFSSSNGLAVELSRRHAIRTVYIANPATKQSLVLPSPVGRSAFDRKCGIAFAASSSKYKFTMPYRESRGLWALVILTFGVDNSWRDVAVSHLPLHARSLLFFSPPSITEGFMHWVRLRRTYCLTMDVESEMIRVTESPYPSGCGRFPYFLSTGKFLSVLISHGYNFRWEVFVMDMESGDWRKVVGDIELGVDALERWLGSTRGQVLKPFGWVKYPEVLAFTYSGNSRACVFYNLDTHEITSTELPCKCSYCNAFVHKNSLERLP